MAKIESMDSPTESKRAPRAPVAKPAAKKPPVKRAPPPPQRPRAPPERPAPEPQLTAEEWDERIRTEQEASATQQRADAEAARSKPRLLTKEEFLAQMAAERAGSRPAQPPLGPRPMTREEYLARAAAQYDSGATTQQPPARRQQPQTGTIARGLIGRLAANADNALGARTTVKVPVRAAPQSPAYIAPTAPALQVYYDAYGNPISLPAPAQPMAPAYSDGAMEVPGVSGVIGNLKNSPVLSGIVAIVGLALALGGTYLGSLAGLVAEVIGLALFVFALVFIFGQIKEMRMG